MVFEAIDIDPIADPSATEFYDHVRNAPPDYVWAHWRMPTLQEIYRTRPVRTEEDPEVRTARGWWWPSKEELQERARKLREVERAQRSRDLARRAPVGV